jgi:LmbE family N-acetylglucosaminyl deacetylase
LGVADGSVTFLDFEDGALERRLDAATSRVRELLERHRPGEVFVPHRMDAQADHLATRRSVLDALAMAGLSTRVLEYPVWLWHHWPWVELPKRLTQNPAAVVTALRAEWALLRDSKWAARIDDVMAVKRRALRCHVSQMERPVHDASWPILADVSHGEWLACFFSGHELFTSSRGEP